MLRSFRVANHKSIRDEQEFLLMPAYDKSRPIVPVAGIFGANASGKSTLLHALSWMQNAVRRSFGSWEPGAGVPRRPFRLAQEAAKKPSEYSVDLVIDGVLYVYGFGVDGEQVLDEWLYAYPQRRKRVIFERDGSGFDFGSTIAQGRYESVGDLTRPNALFLSVGAGSGLAELEPVFRWFRRLAVITPDDELDVRRIVDFLERSEEHRRLLLELVQAADLGISDIEIKPGEETSSVVSGTEQVRIVQLFIAMTGGVAFRHGDSEVLMPLSEESHGTRAWLRLLIPTLEALEQGSVICVDELDASIHPRLSARLIELFRSGETNPDSAQLIFTTHDASLLGTSFGREILARDEIWFTEKGPDGATNLFALSDFHPRKEDSRERRYLGGSYGAVPSVFSDTLVQRLAGARKDTADAP